jgi:hypothetical protein
MTTTLPSLLRPLLFLSLLVLAACGGKVMSKQSAQEYNLRGYASAIRWNEFGTAWNFVDPKLREEQALTELEKERFKQIQVTGYEVKDMQLTQDGLALVQVVEIRLVGKHTQVERTITDRQTWRFDPEAKRWWLTSGLPNIERQ